MVTNKIKIGVQANGGIRDLSLGSPISYYGRRGGLEIPQDLISIGEVGRIPLNLIDFFILK